MFFFKYVKNQKVFKLYFDTLYCTYLFSCDITVLSSFLKVIYQHMKTIDIVNIVQLYRTSTCVCMYCLAKTHSPSR
jgi:hypothetical protein